MIAMRLAIRLFGILFIFSFSEYLTKFLVWFGIPHSLSSRYHCLITMKITSYICCYAITESCSSCEPFKAQ